MIDAQDLHKSYGPVRALRGLTCTVRPGEVTGLLGPNGAGKSTSIRMLAGRLMPDRGAVTIAGHDALAAPLRARRAIGYLPESAPLYPEMTPAGYLAYRAALYAIPRRRRRPRIDHALERCALREVARRRIGALSKGYRQRVALAGAILHDPPVLILDEPTTGLDPAQVRALRDLIRDLAHERTVLLSSHVLAEVEQTCARILIIARGTLRADGTPEALSAQAARHRPTTYRAEFRPAPGAAAHAALRALAGVDRVEEQTLPDGFRRVTLHAAPSAPDLREPIAAALVGSSIRELTRDRPTLEEAFAHFAESDPDAHAEAAA